jgi:hypothetical protein
MLKKKMVIRRPVVLNEKENLINIMNDSVLATLRKTEPHILVLWKAQDVLSKKNALNFNWNGNVYGYNINVLHLDKTNIYNMKCTRIGENNKTKIIKTINNMKEDNLYKILNDYITGELTDEL